MLSMMLFVLGKREKEGELCVDGKKKSSSRFLLNLAVFSKKFTSTRGLTNRFSLNTLS